MFWFFNSLPMFKNQELLHSLSGASQFGSVTIFCVTTICRLVVPGFSTWAGLSHLALLIWAGLADLS